MKITTTEIDHGWAHIKRELKSISGAHVKVGWTRAKTHPGGGKSIPQIAAELELGRPPDPDAKPPPARKVRRERKRGMRMSKAQRAKIAAGLGPTDMLARPVLRPTVEANERRYQGMLASGISKIYRGAKATSVLGGVGVFAVADLQQAITEINDPPNTPITIAMKGSSKPWIDTGATRAAVTHEVHTR